MRRRAVPDEPDGGSAPLDRFDPAAQQALHLAYSQAHTSGARQVGVAHAVGALLVLAGGDRAVAAVCADHGSSVSRLGAAAAAAVASVSGAPHAPPALTAHHTRALSPRSARATRDAAALLADLLGTGEGSRLRGLAASQGSDQNQLEGLTADLPAQPHHPVGRDDEIERILAALLGPAGRSVLVVGPPGAGVDTVALSAAHRLGSKVRKVDWAMWRRPVHTLPASAAQRCSQRPGRAPSCSSQGCICAPLRCSACSPRRCGAAPCSCLPPHAAAE